MNEDYKFELTRIPDFTGEFRWGYKLIINEELNDLWGDEKLCQHCKDNIRIPCFFCSKTLKLFCCQCQLQSGDFKGNFLCNFEKREDHHEHFRIIKIALKKDDKKQDKTD